VRGGIMRGLRAEFKFHNVGQGLFYTGKLEYGNASFNFVYDCGSEKESLVKKAIDREFRCFRGNNYIDLLIISHLHKDHTSGIPHLLKRTKVGTVILPYLTPIERLIVALETPQASEEYYSFLADPVEYLLGRGVKKVILIGGEEPEREWRPFSKEEPPELPPEPPREGKFEIENNLSPYKNPQSQITNSEGNSSQQINQRTVEVRSHAGTLRVTLNGFPIWMFRLFNYRVSSQTLGQFKLCVGRYLKKLLKKLMAKKTSTMIKIITSVKSSKMSLGINPREKL
jgi:hypothetical protein